jgi:hypothetical protein
MARRRQGMIDDLPRVMQNLTIGVVRETQERERRALALGLQEIDQQFQIPVSGSAGTTIAWSSAAVGFDYPFAYAPGMRDSDLDVPQMTYGAVIESGTPVVLTAVVTDWTREPTDDSITGATLQIGAYSPGAAAAIDFGAFLHVTFQGYGALLEDETEMSL